MISIFSPISNCSNFLTNPLGIVPSAPITTGITVTHMFHSFLFCFVFCVCYFVCSLARSKYLSIFSFFFILTAVRGNDKIHFCFFGGRSATSPETFCKFDSLNEGQVNDFYILLTIIPCRIRFYLYFLITVFLFLCTDALFLKFNIRYNIVLIGYFYLFVLVAYFFKNMDNRKKFRLYFFFFFLCS